MLRSKTVKCVNVSHSESTYSCVCCLRSIFAAFRQHWDLKSFNTEGELQDSQPVTKSLQYSDRCSMTLTSLASIPPILLNAGIWIPYLSSSRRMLLISSSVTDHTQSHIQLHAHTNAVTHTDHTVTQQTKHIQLHAHCKRFYTALQSLRCISDIRVISLVIRMAGIRSRTNGWFILKWKFTFKDR